MDLQRQSTKAVLPEPTGPPTPTLTGFRMIRTGRDGCRHIDDSFVVHPFEEKTHLAVRTLSVKCGRLPAEADPQPSAIAPALVAGRATLTASRMTQCPPTSHNRTQGAHRAKPEPDPKIPSHMRRARSTAVVTPPVIGCTRPD